MQLASTDGIHRIAAVAKPESPRVILNVNDNQQLSGGMDQETVVQVTSLGEIRGTCQGDVAGELVVVDAERLHHTQDDSFGQT